MKRSHFSSEKLAVKVWCLLNIHFDRVLFAVLHSHGLLLTAFLEAPS